MEIALFEPQIPQNTGNIIRTCSVTNASLALIGKLGFSFKDDKQLKRAGLDYIDEVQISFYESLEEYLEKKNNCFWFFSSKATKTYSDALYTSSCSLIFGSETHGLPDWVFKNFQDHLVTMPMATGKRCLNLSNTVCAGLYEALRQNDFNFL